MARTMRVPALLVLLGIMFSCCALVTAQDTTTVEYCFEFTWIIEQNSTDCEKKQESGIPCFEPFVVTGTGNGDMSNKLPPNITDLIEKCSKLNCPSFTCEKGEKQCLTWTETDIKGNPQYISRFCGTMADTTNIDDPKAPNTAGITDDCFINQNGTVTVEACACNRNKCNASPRGQVLSLELALLTAVATVLMSRWTNRQ